MKVLITGATGLVGKKLVDLLVSKGIYVNYLTQSNSLSIPETEFIKGFFWNVKDGKIDKKSLDHVDAVIHLAGATVSKRWTPRYQKEIMDSRVDSAKLILKVLRKKTDHQVKHFISASGISIYPNSIKHQFNEFSTTVGENYLADVVVEWEKAADEFKLLNIKVAKVRTGLVLDATAGAFPLMKKSVEYNVGTGFGNGKQIFSWIHVDDLVGIYNYILSHKLEGVYNAVASNPKSCNEFIKTLAKVLHKPKFLPNVPSIFLNIALGQMSSLLLEGQYVLNDKIIASGYSFKFNDLEKAFKDLI